MVSDNRANGWATCPITENGFLRVLSNPTYGHDMRPERIFHLALASGHRQLTDVNLLGQATKMKGCLATFDRSIPVKAVVGASPARLQIMEGSSI